MPSLQVAMLLAGVLLVIGITSSKFSARLGIPVLVLFLAVGMLAGSEGIGRIPFENYPLANSVGSVALALILFDGGLRTSLDAVRLCWRPALSLATLGVLLTSLLTGLAASWVLGLPLLQGLLLGSIVGSTDAAAVFAVLRTGGIQLPERLSATLEVESGSNDPMAIFLTVGLIGLILGEASSPQELLLLFVVQFGVGGLVGLGSGQLATLTVNRINLDAPRLYPLLVMAFGPLAFGLAAVLGGSGFLAVYIAGIVLGSGPIVFRRGIFLFHDAAAWLSQIVLFVMLGLLSFPSRLAGVAGQGLLIALALILVARPIAVLIAASGFGFRPRELAFLHVFVAVRRQVKPLVDRLFAPRADLPPLPAECRLLFPASTTRAQLQRFFALAGPLPAAAAAQTLVRVLEQALARGDRGARIGPLWLTPTADADGIAVGTVAAAAVAGTGQAGP
jgi:potassium/hydrogen antiporter